MEFKVRRASDSWEDEEYEVDINTLEGLLEFVKINGMIIIGERTSEEDITKKDGYEITIYDAHIE